MFCFATCKLKTAHQVISGEIPLSKALPLSEFNPGVYSVWDAPSIPSSADETMLVLDFPPDTDVRAYALEILDASNETFDLPAVVLDTAKSDITPVGLIEYLASLEIHHPLLPPSDPPCLLWEPISNTHPSEREETWGYFLSKACKEWEERTGQFLYLETESDTQ